MNAQEQRKTIESAITRTVFAEVEATIGSGDNAYSQADCVASMIDSLMRVHKDQSVVALTYREMVRMDELRGTYAGILDACMQPYVEDVSACRAQLSRLALPYLNEALDILDAATPVLAEA